MSRRSDVLPLMRSVLPQALLRLLREIGMAALHDLQRRDFTISAMVICLSPDRFGELPDLHDGPDDPENGIIRVLHLRSSADDPIRILRADRLEARLGFRAEPVTEKLIHPAAGLPSMVSGNRIRHEMDLILSDVVRCAPHPARG